MTESLAGRLIKLFHRCDSTIRLDSIALTDDVRMLEAENVALSAELNQCLTAHAELNDKVCNLEDQIEDCTDVNTELRKKIKRLSK